ncbi:MAG: hypothetical protein B6I20_10560 [Bacteroidetes bacterium 4572_117]|nr:MAG: hypothetical protein B6I20_10560 [Bacteroidetes bacterium 4572_117]
MLKFLNRPYPFTFIPSRRIKQIIPIGFCVFLFLILFKPFGLGNNPDYIIFSAYMVTCAAFAGLLTTVLIPLAFPKYFEESKWTLKRNLLWVIGINIIFVIIMFPALNVFLILKYNTFQEFTFKNFLWWFYIQLILGVSLGIIINLFNQNYLLRKHLKIAGDINSIVQKEKYKKIELNNENAVTNNEKNQIEFEIDKFNKVRFDVDTLIYIEALGNYINIAYHSKENRKITVRETISKVEKKTSSSKIIYKPHRSYLVNLQFIENITGDSQGLKIHLKGFEKVIPVSRNKIKEFRKLATDIERL